MIINKRLRSVIEVWNCEEYELKDGLFSYNQLNNYYEGKPLIWENDKGEAVITPNGWIGNIRILEEI